MRKALLTLAVVLAVGIPTHVRAQVPSGGHLIQRLLFFDFERERERVADLFVFSLPAAQDHINWRSFYLQRDGLLVQLDYQITPAGSGATRYAFDLKAWQGQAPAPPDPASFIASAAPITDWSMHIHQSASNTADPLPPVSDDDDDDGEAEESDDDGDEGEGDSADPPTGLRLTLIDRLANRGDDDDDSITSLSFDIRDFLEARAQVERFFADKLPLLTRVVGVLNHLNSQGGWDQLAFAVDGLLGTDTVFSALAQDVAPPLVGTGTGGVFSPKPPPGCSDKEIQDVTDNCNILGNTCKNLPVEATDYFSILGYAKCWETYNGCIRAKGSLVEACFGKKPEPCEHGCTQEQPCEPGCGQPQPDVCQWGCAPDDPCIEGCGIF